MNSSLAARILTLAAVAAGCALLSACKSNPNRVRWDSILPPPGNTVIRTFEFQHAKADQTHFVLHHRFFVKDEVAMPPHGRARLVEISERLHHQNFPVIIEQSRSSALDHARRDAVEAYLMSVLPEPAVDPLTGLPSVDSATTTETLRVIVAPAPGTRIHAADMAGLGTR